MNGKLHRRTAPTRSPKPITATSGSRPRSKSAATSLIKHFINGKAVLEYSEPQLDDRDAHASELAAKDGGKMITGGTISLQSESHPIEFRKVELMKLKE